ncbi:hypothetical protein C2E23DRAFT_139045 [Lenzites betulinus]|nr:hypothetical protein C2E23DRAFT_139045 [Lenzites betulinus]
MAVSSSLHSNMIQFPCLPSVQEAWNVSADEHHYLPARPHTSRDGRRLKQSKSTESLDQRKDRVEFLRRREWTRRVASAGDLQHTPTKRARTYSWEDIIAAADAAASSWDFTSPASVRRPDTIDELDESDDEPYVIYTATPRPHAPSAYTPAPLPIPGASVLYSTSGSGSSSPYSDSSPSPSPSHASPAYPVRDLSPLGHAGLGGANPYFARRGLRGPHSRHSSLSSISEEDEGLARF